MPNPNSNNKKKRPRPSIPHPSVLEVSRRVSSSNNNNNNSVESCLEELEALSSYYAPSTATTRSSTSTSTSTTIRNSTAVDNPINTTTTNDLCAEEEQPRKDKKRKVGGESSTSQSLSKSKIGLWDPSIPTPNIILRRNSSSSSVCSISSELVLSDRVRQWNAAMNLWMKDHKYTKGLLPSLEMEVARHFKVEQLSTYLLDNCKGRLKMPAFERWLIDSKLQEKRSLSQSPDPVLSLCDPHSPSCRRLADEIRDSLCRSDNGSDDSLDSNKINKIIKELCRRTEAAATELVAQAKPLFNKTPFRKGERIELEKQEGGGGGSKFSYNTLIFHCKRWKKPFRIRITSCHYDKLLDMFLRVHNNTSSSHQSGQRGGGGGGAAGVLPPLRLFSRGTVAGTGVPTKALHGFHYLVMTVILRYSSLSGGQLLRDLRGGGMQGAVHGELFAALRQELLLSLHNDRICSSNSGNTTMLFECFASPLNSYLSSYCSAFFDDLDWHFGSVGDFWSVQSMVVPNSTSCCCQANPPFSPGFMEAMVDRLKAILAEADRENRSLSFVVIVPTVHDDLGDDSTKVAAATRLAAPSFRRMIASPSWRCHVVLPAREHGYVEGAQHLRPTRFKASLFDTSVILLQSQKALKEMKLDEKSFEERIRQAFASRHIQELSQRQRES